MPHEPNTAVSRCVIVSDGKRGHENQSRVLARMLGDTEPLTMLLKPGIREGGAAELVLRLRLAWGGRAALGSGQAQQLVRRYLRPALAEEFRAFAEEIKEQGGGRPALFTVSSGTPPATFNLVLARMLGALSVVNMTPSLLPRARFDLNIVPAHDTREGERPAPNVIVSRLALGYHDSAAAELQAVQLALDHGLERGARYWGVAIGGPSRACPWSGDRALDELAQLHGLARGEGATLLVTTSRRTPAHCLAWLNKHYRVSPQIGYFLDAAADPFNPLPAFYELAERMFITADSYSMLCEAVHAGHRPVALRVRHGWAPGKLGRSLSELARAELAVLGPDDAELPSRVPPVPKRHAPNVHYEELRTAVRYKLGLDEGNRE